MKLPGFGLALLLAACVVHSEATLLGSRKCTFGPSYWCHSIQNAKECNAVNHCIQTIWENLELPEDNDDICTLCKNMVKEARDQLLSNETQEEIREVFDGSCRLIPIKIISDECVDIANDFIPELIDTLASQMNPQLVCATAGLCNSARVDKLISENQAALQGFNPNALKHSGEHPQPGDCESCRDFIARTIRLVKTHSRAELVDRLIAICGRFGSLSDGCSALVEANFDDIYNFLTDQLTPEDFCDLVEMCENRMHQSGQYTRPALSHSGDEPCDFCEAIVQHWREVLTANTTEEEFKEILDGLCRQTGRFSKNCLALVDEYYLIVYSFLVSEIQPKEICEAVGLCGSNSVFSGEHPAWTVLDVSQRIPQTPLRPSLMVGQHLIGGDESSAIRFESENQGSNLPRVKLSKSGIGVSNAGRNGMLAAPVGKGRVGDDNKCVMCEFALHFLQNMLEQKDTRKDIEDAVERLCTMMPHSLAEECEDYVDAYGDQVIELLAQEIDPSQICPMLHLCPSEGESEEAEQVTSEKPDVSCVVCEYALTQLEDMLEDNRTEAGIESALERLCALLPKSARKECDMFVEMYTDQVIQMLLNNLSPDEICTNLGLCKQTESALPVLDASHQLPVSRMFVPAVSSQTTNNLEMTQSAACVLCEFAMVQVDDLLSENATEDEIIEVVDFICAHMPGVLADDCIGFVEQYADAIIKLLVHELGPKTVCQQIKLCKPPSFESMRALINMRMDKCQVCEGVVNYIDKKLKDGDATTTIDTVLEEVYRLFPNNAKDTCRSMIEVYGPYVVNLLAELGDSKRVCQAIKFCPHHTSEPLLGAEKCTWGPSYWCQTKMHATACKATVHCETKVWKGVVPAI
uniref:Pulmonary surfactant-associated protein B n=1 Tax=Penaeus monodon TaxID=6687 RepID=E3TBA9_PENMO|nr:saposin isoform 1 [Penaeus monodon]